VIGPGARAVLYLDLPLQRPRLAGELSHRIDFEVASGGDRERYTVEGGTTTVHTAPLPELGPPLRGRFWAAVYDPAMERGHRRVFYAVGGRARIPGRFAIDWFGVDARGKVKKREGDRLTDYIGYGAEVLAVADAVVAAARDDVAEPETTIDLPRVSMADATGNYIALDLGGGRFAFYEHLRPGLRVRVGDRVRKGQVIAELGLTGSGSMPHLHFHVSDANSPLAAEGQPYRLSGFTTLGGFSSIEAFGRGEAWHRLPAARRNDSGLPAPNTVVELTP
jgi:murein DD-endopeptidase MepM/ murein hydrolase activator NlpD